MEYKSFRNRQGWMDGILLVSMSDGWMDEVGSLKVACDGGTGKSFSNYADE